MTIGPYVGGFLIFEWTLNLSETKVGTVGCKRNGHCQNKRGKIG
jgi:hypothetical protein